MIKVFSATPMIMMGPGASEGIGVEVKTRGFKRVLIVTDKGVIAVDLPLHITAATGMDALIHGIEAFTSVNATGITDMFCLTAIDLIYRNIRIAYAKGNNIEARCAMMEGAMLAEGALKSTLLLVNNPRNLTLADAKKIYAAAL